MTERNEIAELIEIIAGYDLTNEQYHKLMKEMEKLQMNSTNALMNEYKFHKNMIGTNVKKTEEAKEELERRGIKIEK